MEYGVYRVELKEGKTIHDVDGVLLSRSYTNKQGREIYAVCMKRTIADEYFKEKYPWLYIGKFSTKEPLKNGFLFRMYIKNENLDALKEVLSLLEGKFVKPDSYIIESVPGKDYSFLSFNKNEEGRLGKHFIKNFKTLLNGYVDDEGRKIELSWARAGVYKAFKNRE